MKRILTALLALLLLLAPMTCVLAVEVRADVRMQFTPLQTAADELILEVDMRVANGDSASSITNVELVFDNETIATRGQIFGGESVFLRTTPLGIPYSLMDDTIRITLYYTDFDGAPMEYNFDIVVHGEAAEPEIKFSRTAEPLAGENKMRLTYILQNSGVIPVANLTVRDSLSQNDIAFLNYLDVGQSKAFTLDVTLTGDMVSKPELSYTLASGAGKVYQLNLEPLTLAVRKPSLTLSLKSDLNSVIFGEKATLTLSVTNDGNVPFDSVTVSDAAIGAVAENTAMDVGKVSTYTKIVNPETTTDYRFTAVAKDSTGASYTFTSNPLSVEVLPAAEEQTPEEVLTLAVESALTTLDAPGEVNFSFVVKNAGQTPLQQLTISDGKGNVLTRVSSLEPGVQVFNISISVAESTSFTFLAEALQQDGTPVRAGSEPLQIQVALPIATPEDVEVQVLPSVDEEPANGPMRLTPWLLILFIFLILLIVACIAALVLLLVRARRRKNALPDDDDYVTAAVYTQDREDGDDYPYAPSEEEARAQISRFAEQYSRQAKVETPAYSPVDDEEPTVYKTRAPRDHTPQKEPRTRQDYHVN